MLFSVVIPTYNRVHLIGATLDSVFAQTFKDYEVIVVDDGSTDGTSNYLRSFESRINVLTQPNLGPGAARNLGAQHAAGEYIAFLDSDDLWFHWTLETFHRALCMHSWPTHLIGNAITASNMRKDFTTPSRDVDRFESYSDFLRSVRHPIIWCSAHAVVSRLGLVAARSFETGIRCFEDQDMGLQLGCEPGFVYVRSPYTVCKRLTHDSLTRSIVSYHFSGLQTLILKEQSGRYPGKAERRKERRAYICLSIRSVSIALAKSEAHLDSWRLYIDGLLWNLSLARFRYIIGFPLLSVALLVKHNVIKKVNQRFQTRV